ncbi:MAG: membrane protein insertase YidC [Bacilli bacterium]|nr:membrane protein insertase YidC [Bacilli bacterium]
MNKTGKKVLKVAGVIASAFVFTGCNTNFCSVNDKAHILYQYDSGLAYEGGVIDISNVKYTEDGILEFANPEITKLMTKIASSCDLPSAHYFVAIDNMVFDLAKNAATADEQATFTQEQILTKYGYLKFAGTVLKKDKEVDTLWANYDKIVSNLNETMDPTYLPGNTFTSQYKTQLNNYGSSKRTCLTPVDGEFGKNEDLVIEGKSWGYAWKKGPIEGLIVYPVSWLAHTFQTGLAKGMPNGWASALAILFVTLIVRSILILATFKSTMSQQKMTSLQPELAKIQAKYPNSNTNQYEKQRLAQDQMALYKKHGINPFSSLLVIIIQFPIFIGVWGALSGSAVLTTGSVFGLYLSDSISNVIFTWSMDGAWWTAAVLFLLMTAAQIVSTKLPQWMQKKATKKVAKMGKNPAQDQSNKTMKYMSTFMIIMIVFMGFTLPSGMGLYWLVGALLSIVQTVVTQAIMKKKKN